MTTSCAGDSSATTIAVSDVNFQGDGDFDNLNLGTEYTDRFAADITGSVFLSESGVWRFRTRSDDGSRLFIDTQMVVNNDGIHGQVDKDGEVWLKHGMHDKMFHSC